MLEIYMYFILCILFSLLCMQLLSVTENIFETIYKLNSCSNLYYLSNVRFLPGVLNTVAKMTKTAVLRIIPTHLYFIFNERLTAGGSSLWCEIPQVNKSVKHFLFLKFYIFYIILKYNKGKQIKILNFMLSSVRFLRELLIMSILNKI